MAKLSIIFDAQISRAKAALAALRKDTEKTKKTMEKPARANFSGMVAGAKSAAGKIKGIFAGAFALLGVSAGIGAVQQIVTKLDQVGKSSRNLGVSAEEFQKLTYAAESVNFPVEQLNMVFTKVRQTVGDAARGVQSAEDKLAAIGLKSKDLVNLRPYEQFQRIAEAIRTIPGAADQASAAVALFGEQGLRMTNFLNEFEQLGRELSAKGAIIPDQAIADAEAFTQELTNIQRALMSFTVRTGFIAELREIAEGLAAMASNADRLRSAGIRQKYTYDNKLVSGIVTAGRVLWNGIGGLVGMGTLWGDKGLGDVLMPDHDLDLITAAAPGDLERRRMRDRQKKELERRKREAEERKKLRAAAKLAAQQKAQADAEAKADKSVRDRVENLFKEAQYRQMIQKGLEKEVAIMKELAAAEKAAGRKLTAAEEASIRTAAGQIYDLNNNTKTTTGPADTQRRLSPQIYSDAILRMGGKIGGIGTQQDYPRKSFDKLSDIHKDLRGVLGKMNSSGVIRFN